MVNSKKKIGDIKDGPTGKHRYFFLCPGCGYAHCFSPADGDYNNDPVNPTVITAIVIPRHTALFHCHSLITDGKISFSDFCTHEHKGFTYNLPTIK